MTETVRLVVLGPGQQLYGTRSLVAGDEFEMSREWADILIRLGKARLADEKPAPKEEVKQVSQVEKTEAKAQAAIADTNLDQLRSEARQLGINVDGRWTEVRLNHEIAQKTSR